LFHATDRKGLPGLWASFQRGLSAILFMNRSRTVSSRGLSVDRAAGGCLVRIDFMQLLDGCPVDTRPMIVRTVCKPKFISSVIILNDIPPFRNLST